MTARVCRFRAASDVPRIGLLTDDGREIRDLTAAGVDRLARILDADDPSGEIVRLNAASLPAWPIERVALCAPVDSQEIWAAGVTYLRSKVARMEESDFSA